MKEGTVKFFINEIESYCFNRFGSMNKNDFEVLLFHTLLQDRFQNSSNYLISKELRIPLAKVKKLRYESDLKYGNKTESIRYEKLNDSLRKSKFEKDEDKIKFSIEDQSLREFIENKLHEKGYLLDYSTNPENLSIGWEGLLAIYTSFATSKEEFKEILWDAAQTINPFITPQQLLNDVLKGINESSNPIELITRVAAD